MSGGMMTRRHRILRLTTSAGILLALCLACTVDGERAATGECPEGEVCSETTPSGLSFGGAWLTDIGTGDVVLPTADGGTQNIVWTGGGSDAEAAVETSWVAALDPTDDERDIWSLWKGPTARRVTGLTAGETFLRVTDPSTGELYDRLSLSVRRVASVEATELGAEPNAGLTAGTHTTVVIRLVDDADGRLVDEGMTITCEGATLERATWDSVELDVPADVDALTFTVEAGHRRWATTLAVH